jgi:ribosome-associated translation inhibitor RaiA
MSQTHDRLVAADAEASVERCLRFGSGFAQSEQERVLDTFRSLDARLATFRADDVELELSVKERDGADQKVTLECWLARHERMVATSSHAELDRALIEVRDDLRRLINDAKTRSEPRNRRQLRATPEMGEVPPTP